MNLVKREGASNLVLTVLIWSVLSVLATRAFLQLTNNPTIGRGQWHIAHVLFGGIFMVGAMISVLAFEGTRVRKNMAVIFGIGWGLFVDEVGKYLTRDNNYWFRPAIMIIYISFILLFLIYRYLERLRPKDSRASFYAILGQLEELADNDLETSEKKKLIINLKKVIRSDQGKLKTVAEGILVAIQKVRAKNDKLEKGLRVVSKKVLATTYNRFFKRRMVMYGLWIYSIYYAIDKIFDIFKIWASPQKLIMIQQFYQDYDFFGKSDVYLIFFKILFDLVAALFFLLGARYFWSKKRLRGIRFFRYGLYVNILLGAVFKFYFEQLGAISDVIINVVLLEILNEYRKEVISDRNI